MDYFEKYLKYKKKYISMKRLIGSGIVEMKLDEPHFSNVKNNKKTIEGRIWDEKRKQLNVGDTIVFINRNNDNDRFDRVITHLKVFHPPISFEEVIDENNFKLLIPDAKSVEDAIQVYTNIEGYPEKANMEGIIFIYF